MRHPVKCIGCRTPNGIPYLQPEIALLYKAMRLRQMDEQDFQQVLPYLNCQRRAQLAKDILPFSPDIRGFHNLGPMDDSRTGDLVFRTAIHSKGGMGPRLNSKSFRGIQIRAARRGGCDWTCRAPVMDETLWPGAAFRPEA